MYLYFLAIFYPRNTIKYYIWNKRTGSKDLARQT
nr:MAG TPA: hypothetical protein [Caudoviricetes sp.]